MMFAAVTSLGGDATLRGTLFRSSATKLAGLTFVDFEIYDPKFQSIIGANPRVKIIIFDHMTYSSFSF
jgi:hypothetical protein